LRQILLLYDQVDITTCYYFRTSTPVDTIADTAYTFTHLNAYNLTEQPI